MSEINYDIINQYLDGELSGEALLAFEEELKNNAVLAEEVALYKSINEEMRLQAQHGNKEQALRDNLGTLTDQYFKKNTGGKVRSINRWWYAAVATAAAAILIFVLWPASQPSFDNEKLYAYYTKETDPLPGGERGNGDDSLLIIAAALYNQKEYVRALPLLRDIVSKKPEDTQLKLALGFSLMKTGQYDSAIIILNQVANGATIFNNEATWLKALTLLKQNKLDECYRLLESLPADAGKYKEAKDLMKKIDSQRKKN
jgi:hypothetical protein